MKKDRVLFATHTIGSKCFIDAFHSYVHPPLVIHNNPFSWIVICKQQENNLKCKHNRYRKCLM